jgi:hypothetical protein
LGDPNGVFHQKPTRTSTTPNVLNWVGSSHEALITDGNCGDELDAPEDHHWTGLI